MPAGLVLLRQRRCSRVPMRAMPSASVSGGPDPPPKRRPNRWIQRFCWSQWGGAELGGAFMAARSCCHPPIPLLSEHKQEEICCTSPWERIVEFILSFALCNVSARSCSYNGLLYSTCPLHALENS